MKDRISFEVEILPQHITFSLEEDFTPIMRFRGKVLSSWAWSLNNSKFDPEELMDKIDSFVNKPVNVNHTPDAVVGYISKAWKEDTDKGFEVWIEGVVWLYIFEEFSDLDLKKLGEDGKLYLSLEAYFKEVECPVCHKVFPANSGNMCSHIKNNGKVIYRNFIFSGVALILPPKKPAIPDASVTVLERKDLSWIYRITPHFLSTLSDEELKTLHNEVHRAYEQLR